MLRLCCTGIQFIPAEECVSGTIFRRGNADCLVDLQNRIRICSVAVFPNQILPTMVAEPPDKGRCLFLCIYKLRNNLNRVGSCLYLGMGAVRSGCVTRCLLCFGHVVDIVIIIRIDPLRHDDLGVCLKYSEFLAGIYFAVFHPCSPIPLLDNPLGEDFSCRRGRYRACGNCFARILVCQRVSRRGALDDIHYVDTLSAFKRAAPFGIQIDTLLDPITIIGYVFVFGTCLNAERVILGRPSCVIGVWNGIIVQRIGFHIESLCTGLVSIPAYKLITCDVSLRLGDTFIVVRTEAGTLAAEEIVSGTGRCVGMQEDTVLDLMPFGIDRNTALRHGIEGVFIS